MRVAIIDYGSGNLRSAQKSFERAASTLDNSASIELVDTPEQLAGADRVVLPGVGAYRDCHDGIHAIDGMWQAIEEHCTARARPFLGICVGMQLMATRGLEHTVTPGFGWIKGEVDRIDVGDADLKIPHMGWNTLDVTQPHALLSGIETGSGGQHAYFVHSYHLRADKDADVVATARYGEPITAVVANGNMAGTQFHPEKSQTLGLAFISNFLTWAP
ncbi:imidazole glycerol phosphate synthase subunit HisH [Anderseniella sp. Alg231-50]|uniref:imidazole glycerol phosphate synthase subunit HisH n=1 Tax=Anderseniella sp. Alg231-50 TaxID=1922226 RepID=UPI000D562D10